MIVACDRAIARGDDSSLLRIWRGTAHFYRGLASGGSQDLREALADFSTFVDGTERSHPWHQQVLARIEEVDKRLVELGQSVSDKRPPAEIPEPTRGDDLNAREIYRLVSPSVYLVVTSEMLGSAVAISEHFALTNCHVIGENTHVALFDNDDNQLDATLWAGNFEEDRCVLETDQMLNPITGARSSETIEIGETVFTVGNPEMMRSSLAEGIVSGVREVDGTRLVQTTAPISHGSSGGALVDSKGNLLGITSGFLEGGQNLNFAIATEEFWSSPTGSGEEKSAPDLPSDSDHFIAWMRLISDIKKARVNPPLTTPLRALYDSYVSLTDKDRANAGSFTSKVAEFARELRESSARLSRFVDVRDVTSNAAFEAYDALTMFDKILYHRTLSGDLFLKVCETEANLALQSQIELRRCRDPSYIVPINGAWGQRSLTAARQFLNDAKSWEWTEDDIDLTVPSLEFRDLVRKVRSEGYGPVCRSASGSTPLPTVDVGALCRRRLSERR